jgi:hypothetical protein
MKKIAIIRLLTCSLLGAGCSPNEGTTANSPVPTATIKPLADSKQKLTEPHRIVPVKRDVATAVVTEPTATPLEAPSPTIAP